MSERGRNTNLASEFYVLSMLYRLSLEACLTLGNKKSVDIVIYYGGGRAATVEVKAIAGRDDWPINNFMDGVLPDHFLVLVSYEGHIDDPTSSPRCWVFHHSEIIPLIHASKDFRCLRRKDIVRMIKYENRWSVFQAY
jgi:hypothetical protein